MRSVALSAVKAGITRLREKGGASAETLYDLVNGRVTAARSIRSRPCAIHAHALPPGTKGLMVFRGKFVVFAAEPLVSSDPNVTVEILRHPDPDSGATLVDVHFAMPFLGYPYVVAEWSDGARIEHYWLEAAEVWQPNRVYLEGQVVMPTTPNGYGYRATRLGPPAPLWEPGVARAIGDVVEPTEPSGYQHTVIETMGANPRSGDIEPDWSTTEGGITYEDADNAQTPSGGTGGDGSTSLPPEVEDRYGNRYTRNRGALP